MTQRRGVLGIIGFPLGHTLSPYMHSWAAGHFGLDFVYVPFEVNPADFEPAVHGLRALGVKGINVTIPFKERILSLLDECDVEASMLQAVNTVVLIDNKLIGFNTDGRGFINSLYEESGVALEKKTCLLLGAGGAAKAIGFSLIKSGLKYLFIANRDRLKAERLASAIKKKFPEASIQAVPLEERAIAAYLGQTGIIINATSLGMGGEGLPPLPYQLLDGDHIVCDIVYSPIETPFLKKAKGRGSRIINGLGMLAHQGALAFQIWTGLLPPVSEFRKILEHHAKLN